MNLNPIAANMTEVTTDGMTILFSYRTPVACIKGIEAFKTEKKWSNTTTRHISKWLGLHPEVWGAQFKPQEYFDGLTVEVK